MESSIWYWVTTPNTEFYNNNNNKTLLLLVISIQVISPFCDCEALFFSSCKLAKRSWQKFQVFRKFKIADMMAAIMASEIHFGLFAHHIFIIETLCFLGKTIFPGDQVLHITNVYVLKPWKCNTSPSSVYNQGKNS